MQKPQNSPVSAKNGVLMEEEDEGLTFAMYTEEEDQDCPYQPADEDAEDYDHSEYSSEDDDCGVMFDYDPFCPSPEKKNKHKTQWQMPELEFDLFERVEGAKENIKPLMWSHLSEGYECPAFLETRVDLGQMSEKEKDKYIEENALADISNRHNSLASAAKFTSPATSKNIAKR